MHTKHTPARLHDLDALRAAAMLLGIIYHAALSFALGFPWMVQDRDQNLGMTSFQFAGHGFRMPLFFLLSGFFTAMVWRKRGLKSLLWQRFYRVLVPCLIGLFTVVPAMQWASKVAIDSSTTKVREAAWTEPATANIWAAVRRGDVPALQQHLSGGAGVADLHPQFGVTPLAWAALCGQAELVEQLIERGADVNGRNRDGSTALHAAAFLGQARIATLLIENGADINALNNDKQTPLQSAGADYGIVEYIASALALDVERPHVNQGRELIVKQLKSLGAGTGAQVAGGPNGPSDAPAATQLGATVAWLINSPVFIVIWFLWFLWWMVILFAVYAAIASALGWKPHIPAFLTSPWVLALLVPLTMVPQWFMGSSQWGVGPDTSMGILPMPHVFLYYGFFFAFGVIYYESHDTEGRLGRWWRWTLPIALLVVFPLALEFSTGTFQLRDRLLPAELHRPATVFLQSLFAWMMSFGCMGMFRSLLRHENRTIRYLSDASYWLYLTHLPLIILAQVAVKDWPLPAIVKMTLICAVVTGAMLLVYDTMVRYTWIGTLLNGKRKRPERQPRVHLGLEASTP